MKRRVALKRDRVNRALESIFDYPLTIVEAPIGYGKTTAVREFLALKGTPVIWTSFLSEDDTASSFWERLAAEIGRFDEAAGSRLRSLGVPSDTPQTTTATRSTSRTLSMMISPLTRWSSQRQTMTAGPRICL